jgi:hypothetical protein
VTTGLAGPGRSLNHWQFLLFNVVHHNELLPSVTMQCISLFVTQKTIDMKALHRNK